MRVMEEQNLGHAAAAYSGDQAAGADEALP